MHEILADDNTPGWLEETSRTVLQWGRDSFQRYNLASSPAVRVGSAQYIFTWTGDRANNAIELAFRASGLHAAELFNFGLGVCITRKGYDLDTAVAALESFSSSAWEGHQLVTATLGTDVPPIGKHSGFLSAGLRARAYASEMLDIAEGKRTAKRLTARLTDRFPKAAVGDPEHRDGEGELGRGGQPRLWAY